MAKPVVLTEIAEQDLEKVTNYLFDNWGMTVCDNFLGRFEQMCSLLSSSPGMFPMINKKKKIRKCVLTSQNTIYYREHTDKIEIITIFDTRQDPDILGGLLNS